MSDSWDIAWGFGRGVERASDNQGPQQGQESQFSLALPLDREGFLRRACPTCNRELKWKPGGGSGEPPERGLACPYCGIRSSAGAWWTEAQLAALREEAVRHSLAESVAVSKQGGASAGRTSLKEPNDMCRIDFTCHPEHPVKVLHGSRAVHCAICGRLELPNLSS
jgi:hypothetical protein